MNLKTSMLLATLAVVPFAVFAADYDPSPINPADEQAIREAVDKYFRGIVTANRELLEEAWHIGGTQMIFVKSLGQPEPRFEAVPIEKAIVDWTRVQAQSSSGKVLSIDVVEGEMAMVKYDFRYEHMQFIDYLTLLKLKDGWKIVNKSFVRIMPSKGAAKPADED